jgi:hypothetical protein
MCYYNLCDLPHCPYKPGGGHLAHLAMQNFTITARQLGHNIPNLAKAA